MDQSGHPRASEKMHQAAGPRRVREFQWKPGQNQSKECDHHREVKGDVEIGEAAVNVSGLFRLHVSGKKDPHGPQLTLLPVVLSPPEKRMEPENAEDPDHEGSHQNKRPVEHGIS